MDTQERWTFTVEEARIRLGLGRSSMYEALRRGEIPNIRIGRRILIPRASLEQLLTRHQNWPDSSC
ncbi:MAG TPA: helix-turn-helix domain-containing protein [Dehalococcoidia bacterium]|nr:helix-turn-helix domain-containing protein [Dehalococcoidia bacterium]